MNQSKKNVPVSVIVLGITLVASIILGCILQSGLFGLLAVLSFFGLFSIASQN